MTTAHQLARKLLAGPDHELVIADAFCDEVAYRVQYVEQGVAWMKKDDPTASHVMVLVTESPLKNSKVLARFPFGVPVDLTQE